MKFFALSCLLILGLAGVHLSSADSLKCFGCHPTDVKSSCKNFWQASEDERKAAFVTQCSPDATACVRTFNRPIDASSESSSDEEEEEKLSFMGVELNLKNMEVMSCLVPNDFPHKVEMNDCLSIPGGDNQEMVICTCDTGDLCVPNGAAGLFGKLTFVGVSLLAIFMGFC